MAQPIKIESSLEGQLFVAAGSFWSTVFKESDKVRILIETALRTNFLGEFNRAVQNFAGNHELAALRRHVFVPFAQNEIIETGMQVYDGVPLFNYGEFTEAPTTFDHFRVRYWALPITDILPVAIQANDRQLVAGIDFFIQAGRYIYFREDPRITCPTGGYLVTRGYQIDDRSYISYFTQTHAPGGDDLVVQYFRVSQTPQFFRLALAAVGRLGVIRYGGKLLSKVKPLNSPNTVIYVFPGETVRVDYQHDELVVGKFYPALTIIGDVIQVIQADRSTAAWWRQINWRGGMLLDPIVPGVRNLPLTDAWRPAYTAGQDPGSANGSRVHARIYLGGARAQEDAYWAKVSANETRSGFYFNSVIGLPEEHDSGDPTVLDTYEKLVAATAEANQLNFNLGLEPEIPAYGSLPGTKMVKPLDIFFKAGLGQVGYIVALDLKRLVHQKEVFDFLTREMPVGCCPIIIGFVPDVQDNADSFGTTVRVTESISTATSLLIQVVENSEDVQFDGEIVTVVPQFPM